MSSIPPNSNIMGSIIQAQNASAQTAGADNVQRNKRARDAKELARLAQQQQDEVEGTEHTDEVVVRRQDERDRDGKDSQDTDSQQNQGENEKLYNPHGQIIDPQDKTPPTQDDPTSPDTNDHIDLSA